jgi:hypothetical protein
VSNVRFALGFPRHKKIKRLSNDAFALWVTAMHHARDQGTDGFLDDIELNDVPRCPPRGAKRKALVTELVTARLWDVVDGGWQIHDYTDWQDSAEQVKVQRDAACKRARTYRARKAERLALLMANVTHDGVSDVQLDISTLSSPESESGEGDARGSGGSAPRKDRFMQTFETLIPEAFPLNDRHHDLCRKKNLDIQNELAKHRIWAKQHSRRCLDWPADFEFWLRNAHAQKSGKGSPTTPEPIESPILAELRAAGIGTGRGDLL